MDWLIFGDEDACISVFNEGHTGKWYLEAFLPNIFNLKTVTVSFLGLKMRKIFKLPQFIRKIDFCGISQDVNDRLFQI